MRKHKLMVPLAALTATALTLSLALAGCSGKEEPASEPAQEEQAAEPAADSEAEPEAEVVEEEQQAGPVWMASKRTSHGEWGSGDEATTVDSVNIYELDEHGNFLRIVDDNGLAMVEYVCDENGYPTKTIYIGAEDEEGEGEDAVVTATYELDGNGLPTHRESSDGGTTDFTFDEQGRLVKEESTAIGFSIGEDGEKEEGSEYTVHVVTEYDENGFITKTVREYSNDFSTTEETYSYELGDNGLPKSGTMTSVTDDFTDEASLAYEYDEHGNITHFERIGEDSKYITDYEYVEITDPSPYVRIISALRSNY